MHWVKMWRASDSFLCNCIKNVNVAQSLTTDSASAASVYSGYEVDDDWCVSVLQSYQTEGDTPFPWSVGESAAMQRPHGHFSRCSGF